MADGAKTRVAVLGGGSGGLELAVSLAGRSDLDVTLVDRVPSHLWKPRLHEFAAGTVASTLSEISFYMLAAMHGFRFEQGSVERIDRADKTIRLHAMHDAAGKETAAAREVRYDVAVVALGGVTADFGTPGVKENAIRLDAKVDADAFRERFTQMMINARATGEPARVVIVGSGATGTELAAHLRVSEQSFFERRGERDTQLLKITILEGAPEIMPGSDAELRQGVLERLRKLDVEVVTGAKITKVDADAVHADGERRWPADATVWAAGLVGLPVLRQLADFAIDEKGRIVVDERLRSSVDPAIYALGDAASLTPAGAKRPLPPTAQVASQQAAYLADALPRALGNASVEPFRYRDKGKLISLANAGTVGTLGFGKRDDILIDGRFAKAAYSALERQHQWAVLGTLRGSVAILADMISPARGPALKLHGGRASEAT